MTAFESHEFIGVGILRALMVIAVMVAVWGYRQTAHRALNLLQTSVCP
jgi:hypothetical protein